MRSTWVLVAGLALIGCDKGPKASGKLESAETTLLKQLPASGDLVFGGDLIKFQADLAKSPLAKMMKLAGSATLTKWQDCISEKPKKMLGTLDGSHGLSFRYVMTGIGIADVETCAKAAGLESSTDADGKFVTVEIPDMKGATMGFIAVDGAVYGRQAMDLSSLEVHKLHRASFEADLRVAKDDNASGNNQLVALMERADRSKSFWFAGSAAKTPLSDKVKDGYGFIDISNGFWVDVTVNLASSELADEIVSGYERARDAAGFLGSDVKKIVDAVELKRDGAQLRFTIKVSNAQIESLIEKLGPMMNMGLPKLRLPLPEKVDL